MFIITVGIDLAKHVFAVHGVNETGKAELVKHKVPRDQLLALIAKLPPCLIGMEACSGAHHWARMFKNPKGSASLFIIAKQFEADPFNRSNAREAYRTGRRPSLAGIGRSAG